MPKKKIIILPRKQKILAKDDVLGRKLQDAKLLTKKRAPKLQATSLQPQASSPKP